MKRKNKNKNKKPIHPYKSKPETPEFQRRGLSIFKPPPPPKKPNHSNHLNSHPNTHHQNPNLLSQALKTDDHSNSNSNSDRISSLPDAIIHHILSHLDTREVVHTSILSNRWRYTWLTTPYLDFDLNTWLPKCRRTSDTRRIEAFMDFIDNVLIRRETLDDISEFRLNCFPYIFNFDLPRLYPWLIMCLERNVKHIFLQFLRLPNEIMTYMNSASTIKKLSLHGVRLPDGNAYGELVLTCGGLEDFSMCDCDGNHLKTFTISTPMLEKLWLWLHTGRKEGSKMKVKICNTPKLESIHLATCSSLVTSPVYYSIEDDLFSIVSAHVNILEGGNFDSVNECSESMIEILSRVYNAQTLQLMIPTEKAITDFPVLPEGFRCKFQNLRHLILLDRMQTPCMRAISNFLVSFPRIESLVWERSPWERYEGADSAEGSVASVPAESTSSLSSKCTYSRLKIVKTLKLEGSDIEISFLAFLLERAIVLEEIIIEYRWSLSDAKLAYFKEKVLSLPQASSNASVSFRRSVVTLADYEVGRHSYLI